MATFKAPSLGPGGYLRDKHLPPNLRDGNIQTFLADEAADPASPLAGELSATYAQQWKPNTAYTAGQPVVNPSGDIVTAKTGFTSGASYSAANWNLSTSFVITLGPSNGTDDAPMIQAALDAARTAGGGLVLGRPGVWYKTRDRLVIGSNTELNAWIEMASGISLNILNNRAFRVAVRTVADAAIDSGTTTLTSASGAFTSADVGRSISVAGSGADGGVGNGGGGVTPVGPINLSARIVSVTNSTTVVLDTAASTTVTAASASLYDRDKNIIVRGRWRSHNAGGPGTDVHHMLLCRVDGLIIDLDEFTSDTTGSKYSIYLADYTRLDLNVRGLDAISDGVHLQGPAFGPNIVRNIEGKSHDDFLAVGTGDNTGLGRQLFSGGSMELEVQTLRPSSVGTKAALKLYGMLSHTIKAKVGKIIGTDAGVMLGAADVQGVYLEDVSIDLVDSAVSNTVNIYANAGRVKLHKLTNRQATASSVVYGVNLNTGFTVDRLDVDQLHMPIAGSTAGGGSGVNIAGTVTDLRVDRAAVSLPASGATVQLSGAPAVVTRLMISGATQSGGGSLVRAATAGQTLGEVWLRDTYQTGASFFVDLATTTVLQLSNVEHASGTNGSLNLRATSNVTVLGHGASRMWGNIITAAGYALRMNCADFVTDVAKVTAPAVGDRLNNSNSAAVPYVTGSLVRDVAGVWVPTVGYAKKGTATLAAGTVTVSDTKVTGSAHIAVSTLLPGGTVGTPYVSARTAGTGFTITSTSAADTSVILYQVLAY